MSKRIAPFAALALALIAISVLVFQPICEAGERHLAASESCFSVGAATPVQPPAAAAEASLAIADGGVALRAFRPLALISDTAARGAAPPFPRYHARSARIQR